MISEGQIFDYIERYMDNFLSSLRSKLVGMYQEALPFRFEYSFASSLVGIDFVKMEHALTMGYNVAIGLMANGKIGLLGHIPTQYSISDPDALFYTGRLRGSNIVYTIPSSYILPHTSEMVAIDNFQEGEFIIIRNKPITRVSDYSLVEHYAEQIAQTMVSRFSLILQSRIMTILKDDPQSETMRRMVYQMFKGLPYAIFSSNDRDFDEFIYSHNLVGVKETMSQLKREYQNGISELNLSLGISSLSIEKESGVNEVEALGNEPVVRLFSNTRYIARRTAMVAINRKYGTDIDIKVNNIVHGLEEKAQLSSDNFMQGGEDLNETQTNDIV